MRKLVINFINGQKKEYSSKEWRYFQHIHSSSMLEVYNYSDDIIAVVNLRQTTSVEMIEEEEDD